MPVVIKRAYAKASPRDGYRVLIDGLWPRGLSKEQLKLDQWMRQIAPSAALRSWYGHKPEKWEEFRRRYRQEMNKSTGGALLEDLVRRARKEKVTLVFAARDAKRSNAAVVAEMIQERL